MQNFSLVRIAKTKSISSKNLVRDRFKFPGSGVMTFGGLANAITIGSHRYEKYGTVPLYERFLAFIGFGVAIEGYRNIYDDHDDDQSEKSDLKFPKESKKCGKCWNCFIGLITFRWLCYLLCCCKKEESELKNGRCQYDQFFRFFCEKLNDF